MTRITQTLALLFVLIVGGPALAQSDPIRPAPSPCPTLNAPDIVSPNETHRVTLVFPLLGNVDAETLGDGDLHLIGPNGFEEKAVFEGIQIGLFPQPDVHFDGLTIFPPEPLVAANYRFSGPGGDWNVDDNGLYRVRLQKEEIATQSGRFYPAKFLGGLRCAINEVAPTTIQPVRTEIDFRRTRVDGEVHYLADVILFFDTPHVRIEKGELRRNRSGFVAPFKAYHLPLGFESIDLLSADEVAGEGNPPGEDELIFEPSFSFSYRLGNLAPGDYPFLVDVNEVIEARDVLSIPEDPPIDLEAPEAVLSVRTVTEPGNDPHQFSVTYHDPAGVDVTTLGDGDLMVLSPCLHHEELAEDPCPSDWKAQRVRLVNVVPLDRRMMRVRAVYEVEPPTGGWRARNNGFYPVVWREGEVCDTLENCNRQLRLGGFEVAIDTVDPPIEARAELRVDASNPLKVAAKVHVQFAEPHQVIGQEIRRDGNRIYLHAKVEPAALIDPDRPFATTQENLTYEIGPLRRGEYFAGFLMNGHLYDRATFKVDPAPPIPAEVEIEVDSSNPEAVTARVKVQFRTPHRLVAGEVEPAGHRILLPAKAEPLPIQLDAPIDPRIPDPIVLEYEIGALPAGGYLAAFSMNDFPYATEDFVVRDPGPPIKAEAGIEIEENDDGTSTAVVRIEFATAHVITGQEVHRRGNRFLLEATARPISGDNLRDLADLRLSNFVVLRFPLGELERGQYSASFVMNGFPYARTAWQVDEDYFEAEVELNVSEQDDGTWVAHTRIKFENPQVHITDPGEVVIDGDVLMISATAELSDAAVVLEEFEFTYELGQLAPGPKWLKFFINDHLEERVDFAVPRVPAKVDLAFQVESQPSTATVTIQFRDHYRVTNQRVRRIGNLIVLLADSEGPLPILAPLPPAPITLDYELGDLAPGTYMSAFVMDDHLYAHDEFKVTEDTFDAEVTLKTDVAETVTLTAEIDFKDPYVVVSDAGEPRIDGQIIHINATAERVTFVAPPSGDPQTVEYDLGSLEPGRYLVVYTINNKFGARARFSVPEVCEPVPHLGGIRIDQEENEWFSNVFLFLGPRQQVFDWGTVRQDGNDFHVDIEVVCQISADLPVTIDPLPHNLLPDGVEVDPAGNVRVGGLVVRTASHRYPLGELESGEYKFFVHSKGQTLGCHPFVVEGAPPKVELSAEPITEATEEYQFTINYSDRSGLDHESIQSAKVWIVGPDRYREEASLVGYGSTDDLPSTGGFGTYSVSGPDGSWDRPDNGGYRVMIDAESVRDLQGNAIANPNLGGFRVRILAEPSPGVSVSFSRDEEGDWLANVEIISQPGQQVVVENWGPLVFHGHSFVALATAHLEETDGPVEPLAHSYKLGSLLPGYYVFAFKSNLAHCGIGDLTIPGVEGRSIDRWAALLANPEAIDDRLASYFFASPQPRIEVEMVHGQEGSSHLGLRFRRLTGAEDVVQKVQASSDLHGWIDVTDSVDLVERTLDLDGTEEVVLCLREDLESTKFRYLRLMLEESE